MQWLPVLTLWFMLQVGSRHWAQRIEGLRAFDLELARLEAWGRSGTFGSVVELSRQHDASIENSFLLVALGQTLERARRQGLPWHRSLAQLRRLLRRAERLQSRAHHHWRLFAARAWIAVGFATVASLVMAKGAPEDAAWGWAGALTAAVVSWGLRLSAPSTLWMGNQVDAEVLAWLSCHLDGQVNAKVPEESQIRAVTRRELRWGVDLLAEKRRLLEAWARREHRRQLRLVQKWSELMPLAELFGLGAPMALILVNPAMAWLA